jgi:hypothetical protein
MDFTALMNVPRLYKTWNLNLHGPWMHFGC